MTESDDWAARDRTKPPRASRSPRAARWDRAEYQRLWLSMESRAWRTLAVVPAEEDLCTYEIAKLIMSLGVHHGESIGLFDFRNVMLNQAIAIARAACEQTSPDERLIFAARSIRENLATIPLARAVDGVILCASIGSTSIGLVEETIDQIGKDRFLGSILVRRPPEPPPSRPLAPWRLEA
jgi:hypothetical protein